MNQKITSFIIIIVGFVSNTFPLNSILCYCSDSVIQQCLSLLLNFRVVLFSPFLGFLELMTFNMSSGDCDLLYTCPNNLKQHASKQVKTYALQFI